jgi:tRNA threonylcarbamoyladenosine biosynthesis protein TsaE
MVIELPDPDAQLAFGELIGRLLPRRLVVYLEGDLGTGKTTLVRGILRGLGHFGPVRSPTYTLIEPYELPAARVYHLDLYRLSDPEELEYLGLRDLSAEDALLLVEWPERGAGTLPPADLIIRIRYQTEGRHLTLDAMIPEARTLISLIGLSQGAQVAKAQVHKQRG